MSRHYKKIPNWLTLVCAGLLFILPSSSFAIGALAFNFGDCMVNYSKDWHWRTWWQPYSGEPGPQNRPAGWLVCIILYCDHNFGATVDGCQWYEQLNAGGSGGPKAAIREHFQSLKNFMAIQQLTYVRDHVLKQVVRPPKLKQTRLSAYTSGKLSALQPDAIAERQWQYFIWDMFNDPSFNTAEYIYAHTTNYCSYFEAKFSKTQRYCGKDIVPLPYDLLASTLLSKTSLPVKSSVNLYQLADEKSPKYYFVDDTQQVAFLKRYRARAPQLVKNYPGVSRQQAALAFIRNLTNPVPLPRLSDKALFDDKSNFILSKKAMPYLKHQYDMVNLLSLARQSLLTMYAERLPTDTVQSPYRGVTRSSINGSIMAILETESTRRFMSTDWGKAMATRPEAALLKEMAAMLALQTKLNYRSLAHFERIQAIMSASFASIVGRQTKALAKAKDKQPRG